MGCCVESSRGVRYDTTMTCIPQWGRLIGLHSQFSVEKMTQFGRTFSSYTLAQILSTESKRYLRVELLKPLLKRKLDIVTALFQSS